MYIEGNTAHCILCLNYNGNDGILVEAEGCGYARKSQFIPNARAIVEQNDLTPAEQQLHRELKEVVDKIAELAHADDAQQKNRPCRGERPLPRYPRSSRLYGYGKADTRDETLFFFDYPSRASDL